MKTARNMKGRIGTFLLALVTVFGTLMPTTAAFAADGADAPYYYDGVYQGTAEGYRSDVTLQVTVKDHKIASVEVLSQEETRSYWRKASVLIDEIVKQQTTDLDAVSGATLSSDAILNAAKIALDQALTDPNSPFVSGDGTAESPYVIATAEKLAQFADTVDEGSSYAGQYIELAQDMDLSGMKWNPIGGEEKGSDKLFAGTFNGNGHVINGLTINGKYNAEANLGLFSTLAGSAVIADVHVENGSIRAKGSNVIRAGLIAGDTVNGTAEAGGSFVNNSSASGSVSVTTDGASLAYAGGLLGRGMTYAAITNSWSDVDVECSSTGGNQSAYAGGIAGTLGNNCVLANDASFGSEYAASPQSTNFGGMAGGMSAMIPGKMYSCYSMGDAVTVAKSSAHSWIGVLAAQLTTSGMTKQEDGTYTYPETGALRAHCYYNKDAVLTAIRGGAESVVPTVGAGSGTVNYDTAFTAEGLAAADMTGADFADTMNDSMAASAKLLKAYGLNAALNSWEDVGGRVLPTGAAWTAGDTSDDGSIFAGGKGTKKSPYQIATADQLKAFAASVAAANDYSGNHIELTADIDISGAEWTSIGAGSAAFNGVFDGKGFKVTGLSMGSKDAPATGTAYNGFFGRLGDEAVVSNLTLADVGMYLSNSAGVRTGALAAYAADALIDGCSVTGTVSQVNTRGNAFVGGMIGYMEGGALINSMTNAGVICNNSGSYPEAGGLVGLCNGALITNCYTLGNVETITGENNSGYSLSSLLAGYQGGDQVNCYADGQLSISAKSTYSGLLSGWMRGAARTYKCWYNSDKDQLVAGSAIDPKNVVGTYPSPYPDADGKYYLGGLTDALNGYKASEKEMLADELNDCLDMYPVDLTEYGVKDTALREWAYDKASDTVVLTDKLYTISYERPDCEVIPQTEEAMISGTWYGRDAAKTTVVCITVSDNSINNIQVLEGEASGDAYNKAVERAQEKAIYGDSSAYGEADPAMFGGGTGTKEDPYLIGNEAQLRYLATSINEDVDWKDTWFKQTADIKVTGDDWLPIGWSLMATVKARTSVVAAYPFRGSYDGAGFAVKNLTIGTKDAPSTDPRVTCTAGMFGSVEGDEDSNDTPQNPDTRYVNLTGINLENVSINVNSPYTCYAGAVCGDPEMGVRMENCSASGNVSVTSENATLYVGGMMGYPLYGMAKNTVSAVDVNAVTGKGTVYAGGLFGMDNRWTTVNSYSTGNVSADSESGDIYAGGLSGDFAGIRYNCYTTSSVAAGHKTDYIGAVTGYVSGIAGEKAIYYASDADITVAGEKAEAKAFGDSAGAKDQTLEAAMTADEMKADAFAETLNTNNKTAVDELYAIWNLVKDINHHGHGMFYNGDGTDLLAWTAKSGKTPVFSDARPEPGEAAGAMIDALPAADTMTYADADAVKAARAAYNALNDKQKADVSADQLTALEAAEKKIAEAQKAVDDVVAAINALPTADAVTADNSAAVKAAKDAYEALDEAQKAAVGSDAVHTLAAAVRAAEAIDNDSALKAAIETLKAKMEVMAKAPAKVKVKAQKGRKAQVSWKKLGSGYKYIVYRSMKMGKGFKKVKTVSAKKAVIKKLKAGKTYYFKVRAFKTVDGEKVYTSFSETVSVKAKK